jgi:uncharacterized membrane protein YfcA
VIIDPLFYLAAVPAVLIIGISKAGFGGGVGILAVPLMALVVSPLQAAGILLPILCLMDVFVVWIYRGRWDSAVMLPLVPAALLGIGIGALSADLLNEDVIRLVVALIAVGFSLHYWVLGRLRLEPKRPNLAKGGFWAAVAGFTSFIAHAGGPPMSVYLLPLRLEKAAFVGATAIFFAAINYSKLVPYGWLGMLDEENLWTSLALAPAAPLGVALGVLINRWLSTEVFFRICYGVLFLVGLKLSEGAIRGLIY